MKFQLEYYAKNIKSEEFITDLKSVAAKLQKDILTREEYNQHGKYRATSLQKRFGSWSKSLELAGLNPPLNKTLSPEEIIADIRRVAQILGKDTISSVEYGQFGKHSTNVWLRCIGSWSTCLELAQLQPTGFTRNATDEELFLNMKDVWTKLGRQPYYRDMDKTISKYHGKRYMIRFGSWRKALEAFIEYINGDEEDESAVQINNCDRETSVSGNEIENIRNSSPRGVNWRLRFIVMHRDNFKCRACGAAPANNPEIELHVDHIIPWSKGGQTIEDNLQTLCSKCNIGKGDLLL